MQERRKSSLTALGKTILIIGVASCFFTVLNGFSSDQTIGILLLEPIYGEQPSHQESSSAGDLSIERVAVVPIFARNSEEGVKIFTPNLEGKSSPVPLHIEDQSDSKEPLKTSVAELKNLKPLFPISIYQSASFQSGLKVISLRPRALVTGKDTEDDIAVIAFTAREFAALLSRDEVFPPPFEDGRIDSNEQALRQLASRIQTAPNADDFRDLCSVVLRDFVGMKISDLEFDPKRMRITFNIPSANPELEIGLFLSFFEPIGSPSLPNKTSHSSPDRTESK